MSEKVIQELEQALNAEDRIKANAQLKNDHQHKRQYQPDMIVKDVQEEVQVAQDRWKYMRHTTYKNGITKNKCVGVSKVFEGENKKRLFKNRGVDMVKFGFKAKGKK